MTDVIEPTAVLAPATRDVPVRRVVHIRSNAWPVWTWVGSLGCAAVVIALAQSVVVTLIACGVLIALPLLAAVIAAAVHLGRGA